MEIDGDINKIVAELAHGKCNSEQQNELVKQLPADQINTNNAIILIGALGWKCGITDPTAVQNVINILYTHYYNQSSHRMEAPETVISSLISKLESPDFRKVYPQSLFCITDFITTAVRSDWNEVDAQILELDSTFDASPSIRKIDREQLENTLGLKIKMLRKENISRLIGILESGEIEKIDKIIVDGKEDVGLITYLIALALAKKTLGDVELLRLIKAIEKSPNASIPEHIFFDQDAGKVRIELAEKFYPFFVEALCKIADIEIAKGISTKGDIIRILNAGEYGKYLTQRSLNLLKYSLFTGKFNKDAEIESKVLTLVFSMRKDTVTDTDIQKLITTLNQQGITEKDRKVLEGAPEDEIQAIHQILLKERFHEDNHLQVKCIIAEYKNVIEKRNGRGLIDGPNDPQRFSDLKNPFNEKIITRFDKKPGARNLL